MRLYTTKIILERNMRVFLLLPFLVFNEKVKRFNLSLNCPPPHVRYLFFLSILSKYRACGLLMLFEL